MIGSISQCFKIVVVFSEKVRWKRQKGFLMRVVERPTPRSPARTIDRPSSRPCTVSKQDLFLGALSVDCT
jgi:hypothetical protein